MTYIFQIATNSAGIPEWICLFLSLFISVSLVFYLLKRDKNKAGFTHTEHELSALYEEYRAVYTNIRIGVLTLKPDGEIAGYNAAASELIRYAGYQTDNFNLFENTAFLKAVDIRNLKSNRSVDTKIVLKIPGNPNQKLYLTLIVNPLNSAGNKSYLAFMIDDTQTASQRKEINDTSAVSEKAFVESRIGVCRLNLFDNKGFATSTWFTNLNVAKDTPIPDSFNGISKENRLHLDNYIHEIKNIQFDEEKFLAFAGQNYHKNFSCTLAVEGKEGQKHYLKLYSEVAKYDPDAGEILADFITINIDTQKEREIALEQTYLKTKEAEELKQSFIVNMSQEINTPLNAITLSCSQLLNNNNIKEERYIFEKIEINTNKLLKIINNIVNIPREKTELISPVAQKPSHPSSPENRQERGEAPRQKILLIAEDNENNYQLLRYMIRGRYKIEHARNGEEAVSIYKAIHPDAILMDIKMPVMDGCQATAVIRNTDSTTPIIAVTAYAFDNDKEKILQSGFSDYLSKPVNEAELFGLLKKYL